MTSPFEVIAPLGQRVPVVAHVPHSSTVIPADVRAEILLPEDELTAELVRLTDWYTDELFAWLSDHGVTRFVNRLSRLVFDPERFLDEAAEPAAAHGQGVVYWHGTRGQPLREPDAGLRERRIERLYRPYHAALDAVVADLLDEFGGCTVIDCHSFPSRTAAERDRPGARPTGHLHRHGPRPHAARAGRRDDERIRSRGLPHQARFSPSPGPSCPAASTGGTSACDR